MKKNLKWRALPCNALKKTLRIMRWCLFLLIVSVFQVQAFSGYAQKTKLSLDLKNASVETILNEIESNSEFYFFCNRKLVDLERKTDIRVRNQTIDQILSEVFKGVDVEHVITGRQIVLIPGKYLSQAQNENLPPPLTIKGTVKNKSGTPIPGATIVVKGTTQGAITDTNGNFILTNVSGDATLIVSFVGMKTQEILVAGQTSISVTMEEETIGIEEVVAVGYGTMKKANLTGAVSQINSEVLESRAVGNIGQAIQGAIPNLNITFENGSPDTEAKLNVRGGTSFSGNKFTVGSPLILVDGVEQSTVFNLTNPEDIESITVLKDASSAAIYGARAAFGVVLVTTKKGKEGEKVSVTYHTNYLVSKPVATPDLLDSYTSQLALNQGKVLAGQSVNSFDEQVLQWRKEYIDNPSSAPVYRMNGNTIIWTGNFNAYEEYIRDWAPTQKHTLTVKGGSEKISYYVSMGYQKQEGIYDLNTDIHNRYTGLVNLTTVLSDNFFVDYKISYNNSDYTEPYNNPGIGGFWRAFSYNDATLTMPLKTPADAPMPDVYSPNQAAFMDYGAEEKTKMSSVVMRVAPQLTIVEGLTFKGDFTYEQQNLTFNRFVPELLFIYDSWDNLTSSAHTNPTNVYKRRDHRDSYTLNLYGDFRKSFARKHNVYALAGFNQEWMKFDNLWGQGNDIFTPTIPYISQTLGTQTTGDTGSEWAIRGAFFRIQYNFMEKYLLEFNGRYDGTSKFPKDTRYAFFPSISAGWRLSEEQFAQGLKNVVTNLKLRGSYGSLGNQNVANYIFYPSYGTEARIDYIFDDKRPMGINPPGLVSNNLTWETANTIDFGVDLTLFNKLDLTFDWYNRTTSDIIVAGDKFPSLLGTNAPTKNSGEMKTTGWELSTSWRDRLKSGFSYDIGLVLSDYQSEITKFEGNPEKVLSSLYVGQKMGEIWGYVTEGLFQSFDEIAAAPSQSKISGAEWRPGDVRYKNLDDDASEIFWGSDTADDPGDRKIIGNNTPRYSFGVTMNGTWKGFDLNLFWQGIGKRDVWTDDGFLWGQMINSRYTGTWAVYEDSWTPQRTDAHWPGYRAFDGNRETQTRYLLNASYIRLKYLTLGYTAPQRITKKAGIEKVRIYFSGQNLWEKTGVPKTLDPELINTTYPIMRSYSLGLQITF
jgi:TonB-linked SusC/RagA family outer membrane protein